MHPAIAAFAPPVITPAFLCYPARPLNGGPLQFAPQKCGKWAYEPKYNGWRMLVHAPSSTCWNRHGQRMSIAAEFKVALAHLRTLRFTWLDCEALERRHNLGRGSLVVFDYLDTPEAPWILRREALGLEIETHADLHHFPADAVFAPPYVKEPEVAATLYAELREINTALRAEVYEGLVAKRTDSAYPLQRSNPERTFHHWMKHRWN